MKTVLVTGAGGQLGRCLQRLAEKYEQLDWLFFDSSEIDITNKRGLEECFQSKSIDYCINCAAYTNVEKAESEVETAFKINALAVKNLAEICSKYDAILIHISTDYVFSGKSKQPYLETDKTDPLNVYGASKLAGEQEIAKIFDNYFIFRTSWLYSQFGHNFYKTILKKANEKAVLGITTAQTGTPTNANHLANCILKIILEENNHFGLYHFSNVGETTWYGFAEAILKISHKIDEVQLKENNSYKTIAARPAYGVLSKEKLKANLKINPVNWKDAVQELYLETE